MARSFEAKDGVRESTPILVGLMGPSGGGKTYSALRLATGMQSIVGGDIYGIDTEARRMLHHADQFKFKHLEFKEPFGSEDYLDALRYCVSKGAKVIIVDSMSHEHEGVGGLIDAHEKEVERLAARLTTSDSDYAKRERVKMLAWQKPKAARRHLINGMLQMNCNFIFCFRAKQSVKPTKVGGKIEMVPQGFMPIAGDEFVFEMTVNCLLMPAARGRPTWVSENVGEKLMIKPAQQFEGIFADGRPLDEEIGRDLAGWSRGDKLAPQAVRTASEPVSPSPPPEGGTVTDELAKWDSWLDDAAGSGREALEALWKRTPVKLKPTLKGALDRRHKPKAEKVDANKQLPTTPTAGAGNQQAPENPGLFGDEEAKPAAATADGK